MKLLGTLRYLGRGECWDTVGELTGESIGSECLRTFTHWFCRKMASVKGEFIRPPDPTNVEEMKCCMHPYSAAGMHGAFCSTDGVALSWDNAPAQLRPLMLGKVPYPHVGFNCTVNHARRFIAVSQVFAGSHNDKTKALFDDFIMSVRAGKYKDVPVDLHDAEGNVHTYKDAVYVLCDNGYHKYVCIRNVPDLGLWPDPRRVRVVPRPTHALTT